MIGGQFVFTFEVIAFICPDMAVNLEVQRGGREAELTDHYDRVRLRLPVQITSDSESAAPRLVCRNLFGLSRA